CVVVRKRADAPWTQVLVPLAPDRAEGMPSANAVCAIVIINHVRNEQELQHFLAQRPLTGLIYSRGRCPRRLVLLQQNPGIDFGQCWEIREGKQPWSMTAAVCWVGVSIPLFAFGMVVLMRGAFHMTAPGAPDTRLAQVNPLAL